MCVASLVGFCKMPRLDLVGSVLSTLVLVVLLTLSWHSVECRNGPSRIIGGDPISVKRLPYIVSLRINNRFSCGGTLVSRTHVVTAAHCVYGVDPKSVVVVGGTSRITSRGIRRNLAKIFIPGGFSLNSLNNDVAVLKLSKPMKGKNVKPTKLCNQSWSPGKTVRVSGWGLVNENGSGIPNQLQTIEVPIMSKKSCRARYKGVAKLTTSMLCAGVPGQRDSCSGDSGGPLMYKGRLCGIVSWGVGCASRQYPGVYTSIKHVRAFIKRNMKK